VPEYRLYCLDRAGKITKAHEIDADDDKAAVEAARNMKLGVECELWEHGRLVAQLPDDSA
jgi:hypothetical protein